MVDDLTHMWQDFKLSEGESEKVIVQLQVCEEVVLRGNTCLVGKLIADRIIGKDILRKTLVRFWKPTGSTSFKILGKNLFLVDFEYSWDKSRVLEGCPWVFEGSLFAMEEFDGMKPPSKMSFQYVAF
jgi:hypothetical protein